MSTRDWKVADLGDLVVLGGIQTGPFGSQLHASDYSPDGIPVVMPRDMVGFRVSTDSITRVPPELVTRLSTHKLKEGDIVFSRRGEMGRCALVTQTEEGWLCGTGSLRVRLSRERALPEFVIQFLGQPAPISWLETNAVGQTMLNLSASVLAHLPILLPPLPEQRKIAQILSTWDEAIAAAEQLVAALQRRKKGLMQRLLTGEVRFPEFIDSSWPVAKAGDIFQPRSKRKNGNEELLSATQNHGVIPRSMLDARVTMPSGATDGYKLVEQGDFVISLRTFQGGIEYSKYRGIISPAYIVLQPRMPIVAEFYKHLLKSQEFISRLSVAVIGIRDGKQISYGDFASIKLACPTVDEQERIAQVLKTCDDEIDLHVSRLRLLRKQKKGLMQRLLTGQVQV